MKKLFNKEFKGGHFAAKIYIYEKEFSAIPTFTFLLIFKPVKNGLSKNGSKSYIGEKNEFRSKDVSKTKFLQIIIVVKNIISKTSHGKILPRYSNQVSYVCDIWRRWCWIPFYSQHKSSLASDIDLEVIVTQCHNMDEFIGIDSSFIPKHDANMQQANLCSVDLNMLVWMLWTCAKHNESFVTWRHCAWRMICHVKHSSEPTCIAALQNLKNTCYVHYAHLPITHFSN